MLMDKNIEQDKHEYLNDPSTKQVAKEIRMVMCKYNVWYDVVNVPKVIYQFPATPIICNCKDGNTTSQLVLRNMLLQYSPCLTEIRYNFMFASFLIGIINKSTSV